MARRKVRFRNVSEVSGEANIAGCDLIKSIKTIYQRGLTAAEFAALELLKRKMRTRGIRTRVDLDLPRASIPLVLPP